MNERRDSNASIFELSIQLDQQRVSARELVDRYLERIAELDSRHRAVLAVNAKAREIAEALDEEQARGGRRGPLHGIPILVKDNLDTADRMPTTAGSLALAGTYARSDSTVVARLRTAGAIILGKTNMSEWANFRSTRSSSGWSSHGGQVRNAYDLNRTPGGSSSGSGVAVALGMCAGAIGTETDGSVVSPSAMNGLVGIKPSIGLVSRAGIIPIAASQDTAGPMTRTVRDGALLLAAIAGRDPRDPSTDKAHTLATGLAANLDQDSLNGARLGVARGYAGFNDRVDAVLDGAIADLKTAGTEVVDPIDLTRPETIRPFEQVVMETEFKAGINAYLAERSGSTKPRDLDDIIGFNRALAEKVMPHFGQERLEAAQARSGLDDPDYLAARDTSVRLAATEGIDAAMAQHELDAIIAPTTSPAWMIDWINGDHRSGGCSCPAAVAGYPHVTVPMGFVEHLPVGLSFFAGANSDRKVIELAFAYEQCSLRRRPPTDKASSSL